LRIMEKDFDKWNEIKKSTNDKSDDLDVHEREIWWLSLGKNLGVEIDGKHENFERPVLVLKRFNRQMAWVLPITSREKTSKFYRKFLFDNTGYFVALTQIRTVSTKRFLRKIGMVAKEDFGKIRQSLVEFI